MGVFPLVANTATLLVQKTERDRHFLIRQDIETVYSRLCRVEDETTNSTAGIMLTGQSPVLIFVPGGTELFAISTGTPDIGISEV